MSVSSASMAPARPLYTAEQRLRRDRTVWTIVQGILAPLQFLVFLVSLGLVLRYLLTGDGQGPAIVSVVVKTLVLYAIMITGSIWEKVVFGRYLFAPVFFWGFWCKRRNRGILSGRGATRGRASGMLSVEDLFKGRHFDREIIVLCVRWYLRYKLSFRDLVEMMAERGLSLAHTTIMRWVQRYVPEFEKRWNRFARQVGGSWRVDETYVKIKGRWTGSGANGAIGAYYRDEERHEDGRAGC